MDLDDLISLAVCAGEPTIKKYVSGNTQAWVGPSYMLHDGGAYLWGVAGI